MRRPFKKYPIDPKDSIYFLDELATKYLYCDVCLNKNVHLWNKVTLLSSIGLDVDDLIFVCSCCEKQINPLNKSEVREEKINRINKK